MGEKKKNVTLLLSLSVFVLFFAYFNFTSNMLPKGAGPDWKSNTEATRFIYEHGRLAVLPDDEDLLYYTVYGGTRSLRPPLSYIVSAAAARAMGFTGLDHHTLFRKGSALLCALTVALVFYAVSLYTSSYMAGLFGAFMLGLMPQFTFIASYNNDDSGAIFSAALMFAVLARIYRYGASTSNAVLIGLAGGLVVLSKMSAWLMLPFVALFLLFFFRAPGRALLRYAAIAGVVFVVSGGWWLASNVYHYGIDDPFARKVLDEVVIAHRRLPPEAGVGFAAHGIGFRELLVDNYKNFIGESAWSTIGNLDWLRIRMGPLQYGFYMAVFYIAMIYYLFRLLAWPARRLAGGEQEEGGSRRLLFETLLVLMIVFQFIMYTWTNIHNDIQIQGKYIIPVLPAVLLLFFPAVSVAGRGAQAAGRWLAEHDWLKIRPAAVRVVLFIAALLFVVYVHWHAWVNYVIPYYRPIAYDIKAGEFKPLRLHPGLHASSRSLDIRQLGDSLQYTVTGSDPQANFTTAMCRYIGNAAILRLFVHADTGDTLQLFIDEGNGYSSRHSFTADYPAGDSEIIMLVTAKDCRRVRFDPAVGKVTLRIDAFQISRLNIKPRTEEEEKER